VEVVHLGDERPCTREPVQKNERNRDYLQQFGHSRIHVQLLREKTVVVFQEFKHFYQSTQFYQSVKSRKFAQLD